MKSSRSLGWLVWEVAGGAGAPSEETPSALCLTCSFWSRRSFLTSLAFRHRGRLASAPRPAWQRTRRGERNCLDAPLRRADEEKKTFQSHRPRRGFSFSLTSSSSAAAVLKMSVSSYLGLFFLATSKFGGESKGSHKAKGDCDVQVFFEG